MAVEFIYCLDPYHWSNRMGNSPNPELDRIEQLLNDADRAFEQAHYAAAGELSRAALELSQAQKPPDEKLAARCLFNLGRALNTQAKFDEAYRLVSPTPPILAYDPLLLARVFVTLGEITSNMGDQLLAKVNYESAYKLRLEWLGKSHPDTLDSLSMLAALNFSQGNKDTALDLIHNAVAAADKYRGEPHPGIGRVYQRQGRILTGESGRFAEAQAAFERALAIFVQSEGPDHPDNGLALNNLANLLAQDQQWDKARDLLLRSLAIHERAYGLQGAFTMFVLRNLSDIEQHLSNFEAAYHYAARALINAVRSLGARSPHALSALRRLVVVLGMQSKGPDSNAMQMAIPFHVCLVSLEIAAGKRDPGKEDQPGARLPPEQAAARLERLVDRLETQVNRPPRSVEEQAAEQEALVKIQALVARGEEVLKNGGISQAHALFTLALEAQETLLGPDRLEHLPLLEKLAWTNENLGFSSAILPLRKRAVAINSAVLGEDHPKTLLAMSSLYGQLLYEYGKESAQPILERIHELMEQSLGADDLNTQIINRHLDWVKTGAHIDQIGHPVQGPSRSERIEAAAQAFSDPAGLLAGLEEVEWHAVTHAYGPADDVPRLLRLLLSNDPQVRQDGWEDLLNRIWHQGTIYAATAVVVPFMIRLAADEAYPDRLAALDTLAGWADCSSYLAVYSHPGVLLVDRKAAKERSERWELGRYLKKTGIMERVSGAVSQSLPLMIHLLDAPELEIRLLALFTLSRLRDREAESVTVIKSQLEKSSDSILQAGALYALRSLLDGSPESVAFFARWMTALNDDPQVTFQAAAGVIERAQGLAPGAAVDGLLTAWPAARQRAKESGLETHKSLYAAFFQVYVSDLQVLACLGVERGWQALARALSLMQPSLADEGDLLLLAGAMLDLLFNDGVVQDKSTAVGSDVVDGERIHYIKYWSPKAQPRRDPASLTASQRAALDLLLNLPSFWQVRHNLLPIYGLPESQGDLRQFLNS